MELVDIFASPSCLLVIAVTLLAVYLLYSTGYAPYQVLSQSSTGIPHGPTPLPFFGNSFQLKKMGYVKFFEENYKKYGPVFSYYIGRRPMMVVADLELIKEITVKKFDSFMDRPLLGNPALLSVAPNEGLGLPLEAGETWRRHRGMLSPTFTSLKLKAMLPLIKSSCDCLIEKLEECTKSSNSIDILSIYKQLFLEVILATAFGRAMNAQKGDGDQLIKALEGIFVDPKSRKNVFSDVEPTTLLSHAPWLEKPLRYVVQYSKKGQLFKLFRRTTTELVRVRREDKEPSKYKDFLQLMIEARVDGDGESNGHGGEVVSKMGLTDEEIASQSIAFLVAGLHTVSNAMAQASYHLALHPDVQERLRTEIDDYFSSNPDKPLYNALQELKYLDMVVLEALRLSSNTKRNRFCVKTTKIGDLTIPEGTTIHIASRLIHRLPDYWHNPDEFDPERFTPEEKAKRPQLAFMPFGLGPRNCIGMRFALTQIKLVLVEILKKYKFVRSPDTEMGVGAGSVSEDLEKLLFQRLL